MEKHKSNKTATAPLIEKEVNSFAEIKVDFLKKKKQTKITIHGIEVYFPYPPYECQLNYMTKGTRAINVVIEALNNKSIAALESPTGTGKTLCLLCSALGWVNAKRKEMMSSLSDEKVNPPVIYYSTRTHSQISNVIKELKKTIYQPKTCVLSSRDNLCVNKLAKEASGPSLNIQCKKLRIKKECKYFFKTESLYGANSYDLVDIEELCVSGAKYEFCPFYLQRHKLLKAEIVFLPYNYIFDQRFRTALKIDLKASNAVLLIDEAHNIVNSLEDAKTFELSYKTIDDSLNEIKNLKVVSEKNEVTFKCTYLELKEEEKILTNIKNYIKTSFQPKIGNWPNVGQKLNPEEFFKIFFTGSKTDFQKKIDEVKDIFEGLTPKNITQHIEKLKAIETDYQEVAGKSTILSTYIEFLDTTKTLYNNYIESKDYPAKAKLSFVNNYKIFVQDEDPNGGSNNHMNNRGRGSNGVNKLRTLSLFCFNPGFAFGELMDLRSNGIVITSGTLSPIEGIESELKVQFAIKLENKHVIDPNQVNFTILPISPRVKNLTYAFDMNARGNNQMIEDLGITVLDLCRVTPGGVLVFFTAFGYMKCCLDVWAERQILSMIEAEKELFQDMQDPNKNKIVLESFKKNNLKKGYRGAVLFSVLRGKCSEGIDFSDELARLVVVIGIPYASLGDVKVQLKKEYLGEYRNMSFRRITPGEWYTENATRAVNQALGRVIRHVDDYGVMVLIDQRYLELSNKRVFSSWLRQIVKKYTNFEFCELFLDIQKFFNKMKSFIKEKKVKDLAKKSEEENENKEIIIHLPPEKKENKLIPQVKKESEESLKRISQLKEKRNSKTKLLATGKENLVGVAIHKQKKQEDFVISDDMLNEISFDFGVDDEGTPLKQVKGNEFIACTELFTRNSVTKLSSDKKKDCRDSLPNQNRESISKKDSKECNIEELLNQYNTPNKKKTLFEKMKQMLSQEEINQLLPQISSNIPIAKASEKKDGKVECQICFERSESNLAGECGHIYCSRCWMKLFENSKVAKCPACKKEMKKTKLRKVFI